MLITFLRLIKKRLDQLEVRKEELEISILQEELQKPPLKRDQVIFWLHKYRDKDMSKPDHMEQRIDGFINAVFVYDDQILFTFNYKDGTKEISLDDVKRSDLGVRGAPAKSPLTMRF